MKKKFFPARMLSFFLALILLAMLAACNNNGKVSTAVPVPEAEKQRVNFWYFWPGEKNGKAVTKVIEAYNKSQNEYEVFGQTIFDENEIVAANDKEDRPDVIYEAWVNFSAYSVKELAMPLDDFIKADGLETSIFVKKALEEQMLNGEIMAFPVGLNVSALYYNKDILEQEGITQLPGTLEEVMEMCHQLTKVENGTVTQMGGPFGWTPSWYDSFTYAFGGSFGTDEEFTPETQGFQKTVEFLESEMEGHGRKAMFSYISNSIGEGFTLENSFLQGTMAFYIDGPWLGKRAEQAGMNFGVMPLPGTKEVGGSGWSSLSTTKMYIPKTTKNVQGAWDFLKYVTVGEGNKPFIIGKGDLPINPNLPANKNLLADEEVMSGPTSEVFLEIIQNGNLMSFPSVPEAELYRRAVNDAITDIIVGEGTTAQEARETMIERIKER